jgi:polysaccharide export outer membrane protein
MLLSFAVCCSLSAQVQTPIAAPQGPVSQGAISDVADRMRADYKLGPGDQILVRSLEMEELNERLFVVDGDGNIALPLIGVLHVGGLTADGAQKLLLENMRKYIRDPQVTVTIMRYRADPVYLVGGFRSPGTYPLQGQRTVGEMLLTAGGLAPGAVRRIRLARKNEYGAITLPATRQTESGTVAEMVINNSGQLANPSDDIALKPYDVLTAERAELIYLTGEVGKVGGIEVGDRESMTIMQAIASSGGLTRDANGAEARVLRQVMDTNRRAEIPVNVSRIIEGRDKDFVLLPSDVLFVPRKSGAKRNAGRTLLYVAPMASTLIWLFR